jgi:hypothetical protein
MIWPQASSIAEFAGTWWVAHTKPRNEKTLAWQLLSKEVAYFLPMHWKITRRQGRTFRSLLPLFAGYLFFCGSEDSRLEVLKTNRTAGIIPVENQSQLIKELLPIETLLKIRQTRSAASLHSSGSAVPGYCRPAAGHGGHCHQHPAPNPSGAQRADARAGSQRGNRLRYD